VPCATVDAPSKEEGVRDERTAAPRVRLRGLLVIHQVVALSLRFRVLVLGAAAAVLALSVVQLPGAPVDELPEFTPPEVQIQTEANGLSAPEVEQLITVPQEHDLLNGVQWLSQIRSESTPGLSSIDLVFDPGTDPVKARQAVQERMSQAFALPPVGSPPVIVQPTAAASRVMMIGLSSKDLSLIDLSVLARWKIKPRLTAIPGVSNVTIWGQRDKQLQVQVDPARLRQNGVTLDEVVTAAGNALVASPLGFLEASTPGTGGFVDMTNQRLAVQHVLPIDTPLTLGSVTLQDSTGRTMRLDQVSTVVEDHQPLIGDAVVSAGSGQGVMLVVQKFPGASTRDVTAGVQAALDSMRPGLTGVRIDPNVYQAQSYLDATLRNLGVWTLAGALLLLAVLALALFSWRLAVIGFVSILVSMVTATYALYLAGTTFNLMILAGLAVALGLVVDDALTDLGSIRRALREQRSSGGATSPMDAVAGAWSAVGAPRVYATLLILLAPLPLVFLGGVTETFSRPAVLAYVLAVLSSTLVALLVAPSLALLLLRGEPLEPRTGPLGRAGRWLFDRTVPRFASRPGWAYGIGAALVLGLLAVVPQVTGGGSLVPAGQDRSLLIHWQAAPGTSLTEMDRITTAATRELASVSGVRDVGAELGRAVRSDEIAGVDSGQIWVTLADSADYDTTVAAIGTVLQGYPGLRSDVATYPQDRVQQVRSGTSDSLVVRVYGVDLGVLQQKAEELRRKIAKVPGVVQPAVEAQAYEPTLQVEVNLQQAQRYGINPGDVRRTATTYFQGLTVGQLYQDQAVFDVVVKGVPQTLSTPAALSNLLIDTPSGDQVRLSDVAAVSVVPQATAISHDATLRSLDVTASVSGRDLGSVLNDVRAQVNATPMPLEYHAEVLDNLSQQQNRVLQVAGLAAGVAVVALLLLQAALLSWRLAALVLLTVPLAGAGGVVAAAFAGGLLSIGALVGLFTVLGIAARNGVVLVGAYRRLEGVTADPEAVLRATRERAGSIVLTAVATAAVMLPPVLLGGVPGADVLHPLAAVVVGGLATTTLLTLCVLPTLYLRFAPPHNERRDLGEVLA
jgi:Cu/Ag efflux pump CusA